MPSPGRVLTSFAVSARLHCLTGCAGYLIEKSLSVDNLFVFVVVLGSFAVPAEHQEKALLLIAGALVMRAVFIAIGRCASSRRSRS